MLEYWDTDPGEIEKKFHWVKILGSGKMESWVIVKFLFTGIK
jgi:hypothetical protein